MSIFYRLGRWITIILRYLLYRVSFEGRENVPLTGGYLVVSNHHSLLDPVFLAHGIKRQIFFMAKAEMFNNKLLALIWRWLGGFSVDRGAGDAQAIHQAVTLIEEGKLIGIFPEGTRSKDGHPLRPKSGAALVARLTHADILPCAILFEGRMRLWKKVRVRYGKPIPFEALGMDDDSHNSLRRASKEIMSRIIDLMELEEEADES